MTRARRPRRKRHLSMELSLERHAIIIGGGASGVLLAYQLLQHPESDLRVTLIEKRSEVGRGMAYHTGNSEHVLNVRAANMSALPDDPDHFWRWLSTHDDGRPACPDPYCFVPRRLYGDYIAGLIEPFVSAADGPPRLSIVRGECIAVSEGWGDVTVSLATDRAWSESSRCLPPGTMPRRRAPPGMPIPGFRPRSPASAGTPRC